MPSRLIDNPLIALAPAWDSDKTSIITELCHVMKTAGVTDDVDTLIADTPAREESGSTALPQGVAIPHCRTSAVAHPVIAFASLSKQVLFDGSQNPVDLVFLIVVPLNAKRAHLKILSTLARALINQSAAASLRAATTPTQVEAIISASLNSQTAMRKIMHRVPL
ncbi:PTS system fructose subfamily transporter subunit IIC [Corynebacterium diphtheriae]|nr:PTS system fructose subfamily transporter subunit IIC [Corynebacterium diphtheriae]